MPSQPAPLPPIKLELLALQLQGFRCCPCACEFITVASSCGSSSCFLLLWRSGKRKSDVRYRLDGARGLFSSTGAAAGVPREQNPAAVRHLSSKRLTPGLQRKGDTPERCSSPEEEQRAPAPVPPSSSSPTWGRPRLHTHLSRSALWQQYCWEEWAPSSPRSHTNTGRCPRSSHAHCSSTARNVSYSETREEGE